MCIGMCAYVCVLTCVLSCAPLYSGVRVGVYSNKYPCLCAYTYLHAGRYLWIKAPPTYVDQGGSKSPPMASARKAQVCVPHIDSDSEKQRGTEVEAQQRFPGRSLSVLLRDMDALAFARLYSKHKGGDSCG